MDPNGRIFFTFYIGNFCEKTVKKIQIWLKTDKYMRHFTQRSKYILFLPATYIRHKNIFCAKLNFLYRQLHDSSTMHTEKFLHFICKNGYLMVT